MSTVITKRFELSARNIVRLARKHKINMQRGNFNHCVRGVLNMEIFGDTTYKLREQTAEVVGRTYDDITALEYGFENVTYNKDVNKNRYFKVGQNVARLAKLDD